MKPPRLCPDCGASLDPQEICECQKKNGVAYLQAELERKSDALREQIFEGIRKDAEIRKLTADLEAAEKRARDAEIVLQHIPEYWKVKEAKDRILNENSEAV